jgi:hypothetical protein
MDRILVYLSGSRGHIIFSSLKYLQEKIPIEIFTVNDQSMSSREFFEKQEMVKIKKTWFYKNNIKSFHNPNMTYLRKIEKEFGLKFWEIINADPNFYSFDGVSRFTESEIYSLIEDDCKFFEKILNEAKPDFLIIHTGGQKQMNLLREMCKAKEIKILQFAPAKLGRRFQISSKYDVLDNISEIPLISIDEKISEKYLITLQNRLNQSKYYKKMKSNIIKNKIFFILGVIQNFGIVNKESKFLYTNLKNSNMLNRNYILLKNNFKKILRKRFLNKNSLIKIPNNEKVIIFSLHMQPEYTTSVITPFFTDQIALIRNIARSLPIDYFLYVKEHPSMGIYGYWREISYYKKILEIPNVRLIHPDVDSLSIYKNSDIIITINGSASNEALMLKKSSIVFAEISEKVSDAVNVVSDVEKIPQTIRSVLNKGFTEKGFVRFFEQKFHETIDLDLLKIEQSIRNLLYKKNTEIAIITTKKMNEFLKINQNSFEIISNEFLRKIRLLNKSENP